jgi:hypothetical protein
VSQNLPEKVVEQLKKAGLPTSGAHPFKPRLALNKRGDQVIEKQAVAKGPKKGKVGYVDDQGRIWVKDHAHGPLPDHWDVEIDDGDHYIRVNLDGEEIP